MKASDEPPWVLTSPISGTISNYIHVATPPVMQTITYNTMKNGPTTARVKYSLAMPWLFWTIYYARPSGTALSTSLLAMRGSPQGHNRKLYDLPLTNMSSGGICMGHTGSVHGLHHASLQQIVAETLAQFWGGRFNWDLHDGIISAFAPHILYNSEPNKIALSYDYWEKHPSKFPWTRVKHQVYKSVNRPYSLVHQDLTMYRAAVGIPADTLWISLFDPQFEKQF